MNRGMTGVLPRTPKLEDESQMGFYESLRNFAINDMFPRLAQSVEARAEEAGFSNRGAAIPFDKLNALTEREPAVATWKRIMRTQQHASWKHVRASLLADQAVYEAELTAAERRAPQRLHVDPAFVTPEYAKFEIHLQPGGYVGDSLAGYVFHHGTKVFYQGLNDQDELHHAVAAMVSPPADGRMTRILDLGCSIGQGTTALKQRFPNAEVWGLDVALPMVRYAHKRALDLGVEVHFKQALAEATGFPDNHFDVVLAHILFHEVPERLFKTIVSEVRRVLRPGGTFIIVDAPNNTALPAGNRLWQHFDSIYNCEPYSLAYLATDMPALLARCGFEATTSGPTGGFLWRTQATKPTSS